MENKGIALGIILLILGSGVLCQASFNEETSSPPLLKNTGNTALVFGTCKNRTEHGYVIVEAINLHMIQFFPFVFTTYHSNENLCFPNEHRGFIGNHYLVILGQTPLIASPLQLLISVTTDKETYQRNESVNVIVTAENAAKEDAMVFFPDTQIADYEVRDADNHVIYVWSQHRFFFPEETSVVFPSGEPVIILTDDWDQTDNEGTLVKPGFYRFQGILPPSFYALEIYSTPITIQIL